MATSMTKEEDNFLRIVYLNYRVGTTALRRYFDSVHPNLQSDLSSPSNKAILTSLYKPPIGQRRVLYQEQWNTLYPSLGSPVVSSADVDVTLMVCLLRNLPPYVSPPVSGFDVLPQSNDLSHGAHIARIKYYKNFIVSHSKDGKLSDTDYNRIWIDLKMAIHGLGSQQDVTDAAEAESKVLDYNALKEIVNVGFRIHSNLKRLNVHDKELAVQSSLIKKLETTVEHMEKEKNQLKEKIMTMKTEQDEVIPKNIRDQIEKEIKEWEIKDNLFVTTRASEYVLECLQKNSCLTLTGPSGVGKSFIARHTALVLQKKGYNIIPVRKPDDIGDYYQPGKQTVFIVDDICGNFIANQQQIENWKQLLPVIDKIIADTFCKIIVSCRLQVYKDDKFNILVPFKSYECNVLSDKLCLTTVEKNSLSKTYIGLSLGDIDNLSQNIEFFPLLCSLYDEEKHGDVKDFFRNPFIVYRNELDNLRRHGDEGNFKICSLAFIVLFNNKLEEKWFQGKVTDEQRHIMDDTCGACRLNRGTSKTELKEALNTLDGTFVYKQDGIYKTIHGKLFDFLAHYFGQTMIECLIDHGNSDLVHERFMWRKLLDDKSGQIDFIIEIPEDYLEAYLKRFIKDWSTGLVGVVLGVNKNMTVSIFRKQLLQKLNQMDKSLQVTLASTKDTVLPKGHPAKGTTALILTCFEGNTDMVQWMLYNDVDVDQFRDDEVTGLFMACHRGHTDIVRLLLEKKSNVDLCSNDGCSPLYMACQEGHTDIVRLLLERNPNIDLCNDKRRSPLFVASQEGNTDIVRLLLERNPNVDQRDNVGCTPLRQASANGHTDIVRMLVAKNPNIDGCDNTYGCSPLYMACQQGHTDTVTLLLERNPNIDLCDISGCSPLYVACQNGHIDIVRLLLKANSNVDRCDNIDGCSPLNVASQKGYTDIVRLLLGRNSNINLCSKNGCSPLYISSQQGHTDIVKLLLERITNIDICDNNGCSPLNMASEYGHADIVKLLLERNPKVDLCDYILGCSSLNIASEKGYTDIVKLLLDKSPNIDLCRSNGCSPLYMASQQGHTEIVKLLLEKNPNVYLCDTIGHSPLFKAIQNRHTNIVRLLLERTHNIDLCDNNGCSLLNMASEYGQTEIVKLILDRNPNVDICNNNGCSPLIMASQNGHTDIVKLLLEWNANINLCISNGCTPLCMAYQKGHTEIVKLLLERNPNKIQCEFYGWYHL